MKFFYCTVVAACAFTFTSITAEAETFTRIKSENDFRASVVDKNLISSWGVIVIPVSYTHLTLPTTPYV